MKKFVLWGTALLVFAASNVMIIRKEHTLVDGRTMLLRLAPRDPRSLMQGDYMTLRYALAREIPETQLEDKGCIVVYLNEHQVAEFIRIHRDEKLGSGEHLLFYRNRGGLRLGAESFFFQEGNADLYAGAWYGELKVDESGASVLIGLRGEDFSPLGRKAE
ncbi:MAG: hypothetical protein D3924_14960 [Candidatus Electrothrix sp. AR4]|nr:hypothetical protein [Candidatus Electrothrix sp. AR4]